MTAARALATAGAASAALLLCAFAPAPPQSAFSPDGHWRAVIENPGSGQEEGGAETASLLRIQPAAGGPGRVLLRGGAVGQDVTCNVHNFESPAWSLDGGYVYVIAGAWVTSGAVHQVNVATGAERYVAPGNSLAVIRNGPYRGMLLVGQHRYHPAPEFGSYDPVAVVRPDGKLMLTVPGSEQDEGEPSVANWLKAHGWQAN